MAVPFNKLRQRWRSLALASLKAELTGFWLAVQFLTRLPTPKIGNFTPLALAASVIWFPFVGALIGLVLWLSLMFGAQYDPWLGALLALVGWVWITGALHLDGLADLIDALSAAHRDPERLLQVMRDPHIGSFGVVVLIMQLQAKLILLMLLARTGQLSWPLILIPVWARFGALVWKVWLPPLSAGLGERFSWAVSRELLVFWGVILPAISGFAPMLLLASPLLILAWGIFLKRRLGGMSGDCLGAGIEIVESGALLAMVL